MAFSTPDASAFFDKAHQNFLCAAQKTNALRDRFFRLGGFTICLRFANAALESSLVAAFAHLVMEAANVQPDLTICLWDSASTGTEMPPPPWTPEEYGPRGEIIGYNDAQFRTSFNLGSGVLNMLDAKRDMALFWIRDAATLPIYESGAPLLHILHWWLSLHGRQLIHAAAIGTESGGVLLVGKGGSGKSSTALRSLNSELFYAADDYCLLSHDPDPFVHSLYSSGKINTRDRDKFTFLQPALAASSTLNNEKMLFFLNQHFGAKLSAGFPIRAVLCPMVTGNKTTRLRPISAAASLLALAPSTIFQLPGAGKNAMSFLSGLMRHLPAYVLELGIDFEEIPHVIARHLNDLEMGKQ